jgi:tetratricopeptide (TPR) repeat protein
MRGRPTLSRARGSFKLELPPASWPWLQGAMIVLGAVIIFLPVLHGNWLWDDNIDITQNGVTRGAKGLWTIWFQPGSQLDYYPVKASVQWVQWHLWGNDTFGYHLTNLLLHIASALLVWRLFQKLGLKLAWLGGLIFAIHPALVESVAWIAELKNTLSMPFFLLAAIFYLEYDAHRRRKDFIVALVLFILAMLTKPTMVMFPVVILGYAWWQRGRIGRHDLKASAPFFAISLILGVVTLAMAYWYKHLHNQDGGLVPLGGPFSRLALMGLSLSFYFWNTVWPVDLVPIYPQWKVRPPSLLEFLPWLLLGGLLYGFWSKRATWGRDVLFGVGFFLVMLLPFTGLVSANYMTFTWVMDHFLYIPILGLIGLAIAGLELAARRMPESARLIGVGLLVLVLAAMIVQSRLYAEKFVSQKVLWTYTLDLNPGAWPAHNNLGNVMVEEGRVEEGIAHFEQALELNPYFSEAHANWGAALVKEGRLKEGMAQYDIALKLNAKYADVYYDYGNALSKAGRLPEATQCYAKAVELQPDFPEAHNNWGNALLDLGRPEDAATHFTLAVNSNPDFAEAHNNLGNALVKLGRYDEAVVQYQAALALRGNYARAHYNLGNVMMLTGRYPEAIEEYQISAAGDPNYVNTFYNWGNVLLKQGRYADAVPPFQQAAALNPNDPAIHNNLGYALANAGRVPEAIAEFQETLRLAPNLASAKQNLAGLQAMLKTPPPGQAKPKK